MPVIDLENDLLVSVAAEAKRRTGKRPSPPTIWRWCKKGCRGVLLEAVQFSGQWHTTKEAFTQFITAQTAIATAGTASDETPERSPETASKLRAAGVL